MATAKLTVKLGDTDCFVEADFRVIPGEPMVRYYPDGSGYPGSPPEIDCVDSVRLIECEGPLGYFDAGDLADRVPEIESAILAELSGGAYDDELLEESECDDYVE